METILPLLLQVVAGGLGGNGAAQVMKQVNLGTLGNTIAGAVGGLGASALAGAVPGLAALAEAGLAGDGATGLVGGGAATIIVGFVKKFLASQNAD
jgi:hypothetical protein